MMKSNHKTTAGFSLVEMAVVLVIVALLVGGLTIPLTAQLDLQRVRETRALLAVINEALYGYTVTNNHMPCPDRQAGGLGGANDTANDGVEDFVAATGACAIQYGNLPWSTLGVVEEDAWDSRIIYRVTTAFSNRAPATLFSLASAGNLRVCNGRTCALPRLTDTAVAVFFSHGPNRGVCASGTCLDEVENTDLALDLDFVSHTPTSNGAGNNEYFDDLVVWTSGPVVMNKMVSAGKLP